MARPPKEEAMKIRNRVEGLAALAVLAAIGCAPTDTETATSTATGGEGDRGVTSHRSALVNPSTCASATPQRTLSRGGTFTRTASYSATGCANAYVVDLNDYGS